MHRCESCVVTLSLQSLPDSNHDVILVPQEYILRQVKDIVDLVCYSLLESCCRGVCIIDCRWNNCSNKAMLEVGSGSGLLMGKHVIKESPEESELEEKEAGSAVIR